MTLPASGAISLSQVNTELGLSSTATISLNDSAVRTLFGKASGTISLSDGYGKSNQFAFTISANQTNANLASLATAAGWNGTSKLIATINSGVYISSNSTGTPALTVSGSFPGGVQLINNGTIVGMGGAGAAGSTSSGNAAGSAGGTALSVSSAITITNNGTIAGGGGGGGAGGAAQTNGWYSQYGTAGGGGGGGGRSSYAANSAGGAASVFPQNISGNVVRYSAAGGAGTSSAAGSGGQGATTVYEYSDKSGIRYTYAYGGTGGSGGGWGAAGTTGAAATTYYGGSPLPVPSIRFNPSSGGAGGNAVSGNANISWSATGTRYGAIT